MGKPSYEKRLDDGFRQLADDFDGDESVIYDSEEDSGIFFEENTEKDYED